MSPTRTIVWATAVAVSGLTTAAEAAQPVTLGLHNVTQRSYIFERPGVLFTGTVYASDLFEVTRVSPTGINAQGWVSGDRSRKVWIPSKVLSRAAPKAPAGTTEVAGPGTSRVFRPDAVLACRSTNFLTVGVRGARRTRVSVLRGGKVVARSRALFGPGLAIDLVRVPCDGSATVRYTTAAGVKSFRVTVGRG